LCLDGILLKPSTKPPGMLLDYDHMIAEKTLMTLIDVCQEIFEVLEKHGETHQ